MSIKAILFDLDGTLLPMDQEVFTSTYFGELTKVVCPLGVQPRELIKAVWTGTKAMMNNDGTKSNEAVFWEVFDSCLDIDVEKIRPVLDTFYLNEFHNAKISTGENPLAKEAVKEAHKNGRKVVLATNPIFPLDGQISRLSWIGLKPEDFDLITSYDSEYYCKPNPKYFLSVCERIGCEPEECLMIGNDEREDMLAASTAGLKCFLVNDCKIPCEDNPWKGDCGSFEYLVKEYLPKEVGTIDN